MLPEERSKLIERLNRSFLGLPMWAKIACKHGMSAPKCHPETGKRFDTFLEVLNASADITLVTLKGDFESNEDLAPEEFPPEPEFTVGGSNHVITKEWVTWMTRILTHHSQEVVKGDSIIALHAAKDRLNFPVNFPNPDPEKLILRVKEDVEAGTYTFLYAPPDKQE